ncbi:hypothetical protein IJS77_04835 [bacterium]|nr:hypothetical protein [bacterium]
MEEIAFATDAQLKNIAQYNARREFANSPKRKSEAKFANMLPVMDSFLTGATAKGSLSTKIITGGNELKDWGIFILATSLYNKAVNKIVSKSETLQNFRENSPVMYGVANTALGVATGFSAIKYVNKGYQKFIAPLIPQKFKDSLKGFVDSADTTKIGKSINRGMQNFATKYPKITRGLGIVGKLALPVLCLGYITSLVIDVCKAKSKGEKTFEELKEARLMAAQQLASQNMPQETKNTQETAETSDAA